MKTKNTAKKTKTIAQDSFENCSEYLVFFAPEGSFAENYANEQNINIATEN